MMNPAFCSGSRLDSSSGDKMYAPARKISHGLVHGTQYQARAFTDGSYVTKGDSSVQLYLLKGIIVALLYQHRFIQNLELLTTMNNALTDYIVTFVCAVSSNSGLVKYNTD